MIKDDLSELHKHGNQEALKRVADPDRSGMAEKSEPTKHDELDKK